MNVRLTPTIAEAAPSDVPARAGIGGGPGLSGYAPEAMFARLVDEKVRDKAFRRQARSDGAALEFLVFDVGGSKLESELRHADYRRMFYGMLEELESRMSYDAILLCELAGWGKGLLTHFAVFDDEAVTEDELARVFNV